MSSPYQMNVIGFTRIVRIGNIIHLLQESTLEDGVIALLEVGKKEKTYGVSFSFRPTK